MRKTMPENKLFKPVSPQKSTCLEHCFIEQFPMQQDDNYFQTIQVDPNGHSDLQATSSRVHLSKQEQRLCRLHEDQKFFRLTQGLKSKDADFGQLS